MAGVVFVVCVPTANFEQILTCGGGSDTSIGYVRDFKKVYSVEVELRDKRSPEKIPITLHNQYYNTPVSMRQANNIVQGLNNLDLVPMEKILDELLKKLDVEHVAWIGDKDGNYYEVIFPVPAGDPCENLLHCLTQLGIGKKLNSVVSVLPCSVVYSGLETEAEKEEYLLRNSEEKKRWKNFVESIRSKLTVKQVIDGVRSGGQMSFDYLLLIVTADCLAALGLVENNSPNIVAAMLVSPLMGPVMSITFGTIIADRELQKVGLMSLVVGMLISCLFGFVFGLILGTTEMPWGFGDWPTEEMKSRGNVRSLWMGVLWALTSGSGVAVALLQGSAGPLIGVAISASLLPPVVNCGLFWALACIWLRYDGVKIPHLKGEEYHGNSSYVPLYSDYIPIEFAVNGIVSACLTVVNVICIFITAIIVLKIKEVAAPYTSSPELRRFWQHDLRMAREENRNSHMRHAEEDERKEYMMSEMKSEEMEDKLYDAVQEAIDDDTFRKVQRVSYQTHGLDDVARQILSSSPRRTMSRSASFNVSSKRSPSLSDLATLDKIVNSLLSMQSRDGNSHHRYKHSTKSKRGSTMSDASSSALPTILEGGNVNSQPGSNRRTNSWSQRMKNKANAIQNRLSADYDNVEPQQLLLEDSNSQEDVENGRRQ